MSDSETKTPCWTLSYHHRHGFDETDCVSLELAQKAACHLIVDYWDEIEDADARRRIRQKLSEKDWHCAMEVWSAYQAKQEAKHAIEAERFEINQRAQAVEDLPDPVPPEEEEEEE